MEPTVLTTPTTPPPPTPKKRLPNGKLIALLAAGLVVPVVLLGIVILVSVLNSRKGSDQPVVLSENELSKLISGAQDPDRTLTIAGNGDFKGNLKVDRDLTVAGKLNLSGSTTFGQLEVNENVTVKGNSNLQGPVNIGGALNVGGNGSFGGTLGAAGITTGNITASGLTLGGHLRTGGASPTTTVGPASGAGSASLQGNDTAGSVTVNTGSGGSTGSLVTIRFRNKFGIAPRVQITPVGAAAANLRYYVDRNADFFTIGTASAAAAGASYTFDYYVIE